MSSGPVFAKVYKGEIVFYPAGRGDSSSMVAPTGDRFNKDPDTPELTIYKSEDDARRALSQHCHKTGLVRKTDLGGGRKSRRYNKKRSTRVNRKGSKRGTRRSRRVMQHGG